MRIESFHIAVNDRVKDVRLRFENNTKPGSGPLGVSTRASGSLFVGKVTEEQIVISRNAHSVYDAWSYLRANLVDDGDRTIVSGWLCLHNAAMVLCVLMLLLVFVIPVWVVALGLVVVQAIVGIGYLLGRRKLFRALATCLNVEISAFK